MCVCVCVCVCVVCVCVFVSVYVCVVCVCVFVCVYVCVFVCVYVCVVCVCVCVCVCVHRFPHLDISINSGEDCRNTYRNEEQRTGFAHLDVSCKNVHEKKVLLLYKQNIIKCHSHVTVIK